jgi:hypothetical protein
MARRDEFDDEEGFLDSILKPRAQAERGHPGSVRRVLAVTAGLAVLGVLSAVLWSTWPEDRGSGMSEANVPIIRADAEPYRTEPEDRGGMAVPNKDSTIFNTLKGQPSQQAQAENLFEEAETPVKKAEVFTEPEKVAAAPEADEPAATEPEPADTAVSEATPPSEVLPPASQPKMASAGDSVETLIEKKKVEDAAKKAEAIQPAAGGNFYVQLASVKSEGDAKAQWPKFQKQFVSLSELDLRVQKADLGAKGTYYRIQGGPVTEADARKLCSSINAQKSGSCVVAKR